MFKGINFGYKYYYNKCFIIITANSISLSVVVEELWSDPVNSQII